ncbi:DUF3307 domain-containing protein [Candidatus Peregrinibacteria bacterium]|nr:DUF3307 domain-containing protein [Candidatus Peregrinibacteria bacterium]
MSLLLYFYLVHFLADYTFQSSCLVKYKSEHFFGIVIHSTVHLLTLLAVLAPFLSDSKVWTAIAIIYVTHIIIDQSKTVLNKAYPKLILFFYFLDQAVHLLVVTACGYYVGLLTPKYLTGTALTLYSDQSVVLYLLILVLVTYFYDVTRYFVKKEYKKKPFKRDWRTMGMNAGIVTIAFGLYWVLY